MIIDGTPGEDTLSGTVEADTINGLGGDDVLHGGGGADALDGGDGDDVIYGGGGSDALQGGAGGDGFVFNESSGQDVIQDFDPAIDRIGVVRGMSYTLVQQGANLLVQFQAFNTSPSVLLLNVTAAQISDAVFYVATDQSDDFVSGTEDGDEIDGQGGDDRLRGLGGDDRLEGGIGSDSLDGGDGDDVLTDFGPDPAMTSDRLSGGGGNDWLQTGAGDDLLNGGDGDDHLDGGDGDDTADYADAAAGVLVDLRIAGPQQTVGAGIDTLVDIENLIGSSFADVLTGDESDNLLVGAAFGESDGAIDVLTGGGGDDEVQGFSEDILDGGSGSDHLRLEGVIGAYIDLALSAAGVVQSTGLGSVVNFETITFYGQDDDGGTGYGDHRIIGIAGPAGGDDTIHGGDGDDWLEGGWGVDRIGGGMSGDDVLIGGHGADIMAPRDVDATLIYRAGDGADTVYVNAGDRIEVFGYASYTIDYAGDGAVIRFAEGEEIHVAYVETPLDALIHLMSGQIVTGGLGADLLNGSAGGDEVAGFAGADRLSGLAGADVLRGGAGDDVLAGGLGADILFGGSGADTASFATAAAGVRINLTTNVHTGEALGDTFHSIETFVLTTLSDNFTGSSASERADGMNGNDVLNGLAGDDTLNGNDGDDTLNGGDGADRITGGNGADRIDGGVDNDLLTGSAGDDTINGRDGNDILDGGVGADSLIGGYGNDTASYRLSAGGVSINLVTNVHTGDAAGDTFNSIEYFQLSNHADSIVGGLASEVIRGLAGDDTLDGGERHDGLYGGDGNDTLLGGVGRDNLAGEIGNDTLTGGADSDRFWINGLNSGQDTVTDFQNGLDKIRITGVAGVDDFGDLTVTANGSGWAVVTFPDGSTMTLTGVATAQIDANDFTWT